MDWPENVIGSTKKVVGANGGDLAEPNSSVNESVFWREDNK